MLSVQQNTNYVPNFTEFQVFMGRVAVPGAVVKKVETGFIPMFNRSEVGRSGLAADSTLNIVPLDEALRRLESVLGAIDYATQINERLKELNASTDSDPYSGLTAENIGNGKVKIFDDYDSGEYYAFIVLQSLESVDPINWDEHDNTESAFNPIWDAVVVGEI
jgi:hypothetical protein